MAACFAIGVAVGWWLHVSGGPQPAIARVATEMTAVRTPAVSQVTQEHHNPRLPVPQYEAGIGASTGTAGVGAPRGAETGGAIDVLRQRGLQLPIEGANVDALKGAFNERRSGEGGHTHEAIDLLAPRNTPVRAIEAGTIAKLFDSRAGGHTIYQLDPTERFVYYYAHLDRYADGLHDGQRISAGEVIGYVGTTGNAPPGTPHLHFAIFELGPEKRWWKGDPIDPYLVYKK
jgi:murein DD-endopeptidase MepM/ murein hydrolase activator NlpD